MKEVTVATDEVNDGLYDDGLERWQAVNLGLNGRAYEALVDLKIDYMAEHVTDPEDHPIGHGGGGTSHRDKCQVCRVFRKDYMPAEWIRVVLKNRDVTDVELYMPGTVGKHQRRLEETKYDTEYDRWMDSGYTRVRELEAAKLLTDWQAIGILTTICDIQGLQYPPEAYRTQLNFDDLEDV
jgi:hypothetical protein